MNGFINLSREKSKGLDLMVLNNSKKLYKEALLLSNNNSYSTASSLLILSLEECIKAFYILLHIQGIDVYKSKVAKKIFTNHSVRHDVAKSIEMVIGIIEIINNYSTPEAELNSSNAKRILKIIKGFLRSSLIIIDMSIRIEKIGNFNKIKNNGFYVDYSDQLIIPNEHVGQKEFYSLLEIYLRMNKSYRFFKLISNQNFLEKFVRGDSEELKMKIIRTVNQYINSKLS